MKKCLMIVAIFIALSFVAKAQQRDTTYIVVNRSIIKSTQTKEKKFQTQLATDSASLSRHTQLLILDSYLAIIDVSSDMLDRYNTVDKENYELIKAVKSMQAQIESLKKQNADLLTSQKK
jgi:hypothetical protein